MSADRPNSTDEPPQDPTDTSSGPKVVSLGNGYSLVQWTVDDGYGSLKTQSQIVPDKDAASVAASAGVTAAGISAGAANQRAAIQAEIDRAKNAADAAHNAALLALSQGNAAEAKRQFDISQAELVRSHDLDYQSKQQDQALAGQKFAFDVYNKNADLASNPRNYMEQFFRMRGSEPPGNASQYGNNIVPFEQFAPKLLASLGLQAGGPSSGRGSAASGSPPGAAGPPAVQGWTAGGQQQFNPQQVATMTPKQIPTSAPGTIWSPGGAEGTFKAGTGYGTGGQSFAGVPNASTPNPNPGQPWMVTGPEAEASQAASDRLQERDNPRVAFARGGVIPEPVVGRGVMSGRPYEFGEKGPEGVVPANMLPDFLKRRAGQTVEAKRAYAKGGIIGDDPNDPFGVPDPTVDSIQTPGPGDPVPPDSPPTQDAAGNTRDPGLPSSQNLLNALPGGAQPAPDFYQSGPMSPYPAPPTSAGQNPTYTPPLPAPLLPPERVSAPAPTLAPMPTATSPFEPRPAPPTVTAPPTGGVAPIVTAPPPAAPAPAAPPVGVGGPIAPAPLPSPFAPPTAPPNPTPSFSPQTPSFLSQLKSLAQTPSGLGKNPTFLPESGKNPIVDKLIQNGAFPPFLQRLYAQQAGLAGLGTNVPQQTNLPAGVPLASRLSLSQMNPSELAAFQSFISANGLDWSDYLAMVDAASPQGGTQRLTNSLPKFLSQ